MGKIAVRLKDVLQANGLTAYRLAEEVDRRNIFLTKGAVYNIVAGRTNPSLESLAKIMDVLNAVSDEPIEIGDILEYVPD